MKKRLLSLLLCIALVLSLTLPALASESADASAAAPQSTGQFYYDRMHSIIELIQYYGLDSGEDDDPLLRAIGFIYKNPEFADWLRVLGLSPGSCADTLRGVLTAEFEDPATFYWFMTQMLQSYDRYSLYVPPGLYNLYYPTPQPSIGIGVFIDVTMRGGWYIESVVPNSPAEAAGLQAGDRIDRVNGASTQNWALDELVSRIRGPLDTEVRLSIARYGEAGLLELTLTRRWVTPQEIFFTDLGDGVAMLRIPQFASLWTYYEFRDYYTILPILGFSRVIIDVRDNLGGQLNAYIYITNMVLNDFDLPLLISRDRDGIFEDWFSYPELMGWTPESLVILVNENSRSAAELFAGTLREYGAATLVGTTTGGKGYMQYHFEGDIGDTIVLSIAELLLPISGGFDGIGIEPCYVVEMGSKPLEVPAFRNLNTTISRTSASVRISELQQALTLLRYYNGSSSGVWNDTFHNALRAFQRDNGLRESGFADAATMALVRAGIERLRTVRVESDTQLEKALEVVRR
jgi:carboxyl-terminal processing protease